MRLFTVIGAVLLAGFGRGSPAAVLPPGEGPTPANIVVSMAFNFLNPPPIEVVTFGEHQLSGPGGRLRVDSELFPSPYLHSSVVEIRDGWYARVAGTTTYEVVIVGPPGNVDVEIHAAGQVNGNALPPALGGGSFVLQAQWFLENPFTGAVIFADPENIQTPQISDVFFDSFDHKVSVNLPANQRIRVKLIADAGIANGVTNGGIGSAYAFVDPVFSFGPSVGSEYSFVFSENVGNLPIPEPTTYALMAAGLLGLGLRRLQLRPDLRRASRRH